AREQSPVACAGARCLWQRRWAASAVGARSDPALWPRVLRDPENAASRPVPSHRVSIRPDQGWRRGPVASPPRQLGQPLAAPIVGSAVFCGSCGMALRAPPGGRFVSPGAYTPRYLAERILNSRNALEGERKQVTVLFCDLANSTPLAEILGPEAMHGLLEEFFELGLNEVHRYEGTINQFLGDGFMALFGAPLAREDHAHRAVLAALGIQRALHERASGAPRLAEELEVRIGVNTGLVVVGKIGDNLRMDYTAVGDTTHIAGRLEQLAEPGSIVISEATYRLVRGYVRAEDLGGLSVKGKSDPGRPYKVVGPGSRRSRLEGSDAQLLTRFVGRERESQILPSLLGR